MDAKVFAEGDVVVLKSGGPKMTVQGSSGDGGPVQVAWFDGGELRIANVRPAMVVPAEMLERPMQPPVKVN